MKTFPATLLTLLVSLAAASFSHTSLAASDPADHFERLDIDGKRIDDSETWSCVADNRTKLVWEVKTDDGGIRDANHSYSWFDPERDFQTGVKDGGRCRGGVKCDTHHYRVSLNQERLCGYDDWRLPSREELETLVEFQTKKSKASIDSRFFPLAAASWYWTASSNHRNPGYAWYVLFRSGIPLNDLKARPKHVRLVRGGKLLLTSNE